MPAQWTADVIGQMHLAGVSNRQLAEALGMTPEYISMVLNGHREPDGAEARFREALARLTSARGQDTTSEVP